MDPEMFESITLPDGEELVIIRPDYRTDWMLNPDGSFDWMNLGRDLSVGPVALEDITAAKIIGPEDKDE
ncbi:hypothetical protein HYS42_01415 [Candidatus Saccharibacteria bacterium]|nr:hypothetical protein [Candidatus Saccharibacteria bacterium]